MSKRRQRPRPVLPALTSKEHLLARRRLTSFVYILLRDNITDGKVEDIMANHVSALESVYSNPFVAGYARSISDRLLLGTRKPKPRREP